LELHFWLNYSHPTKINRNTTVLDNRSTTILCILSREQCQNEEGGGRVRGWTYFCIHDRGLDASYMEATGNQNVDLNSQLGTIVATHPHLQLNQNSIPSPPPSLNCVVHPCLSFARFCEPRISSNISNVSLWMPRWSVIIKTLESLLQALRHLKYPTRQTSQRCRFSQSPSSTRGLSMSRCRFATRVTSLCDTFGLALLVDPKRGWLGASPPPQPPPPPLPA